jgi:hypothetical protein
MQPLPKIKRGDKLALKQHGRETLVEAVSDEHDGTVQIRMKGAISTASVYDLRQLPKEG